MLIKWCKQDKTEQDISQFVSMITWSGSTGQASRSLEIEVLYSPFDRNIQDINIKLGDRLKLYTEDKILLINAMIYERERKSEQGTVNYIAHDDLKKLLQSNTRKSFKNTTAEKITKQICDEIKIETTKLAETKIHIKKMIVDGESHYNAIMMAYTKAYKINKKKYMPIMVNQKLSVIEKGEIIDNFYLDEKVNVMSSSYSESIENIKNKVKIYDEDGKQVGEVKEDKSIELFGIFQEVYTKENDTDSTTAAKSMLQGIDKSASIEALGNIACVAGYGIKIKDSVSGLTGKFWITSDSHTWENGMHNMSLELAFKNIMDLQEEGETKKKKKGKKARSKTDNNSIVYITAASAKYHSYKTCSGMKQYVEVTKKDAIQRGKGECSKCWR